MFGKKFLPNPSLALDRPDDADSMPEAFLSVSGLASIVIYYMALKGLL